MFRPSVFRRRNRGRRLVAGGVVVVLVAGGLLAWRLLGSGSHPGRYGMTVVSFAIDSRLVGRRLVEVGIEPPSLPDGKRRPLLVLLHGRGSSPGAMASDQLFAALRSQGDRAPDVVAVDGGDDSYYHDRAGGKWGSYVVREVVPEAIRRLHANPHRVAIGGESMGGFGALDLARLHPHRFCAAGGHSAAIFEAGRTAPGAFDDAADFARHDLLGWARRAPHPYSGMRIWLDVGDQDPFRPADIRFAREIRSRGANVRLHVWPGAHETAYWDAHMARYVAFYAHALGRC